MISVENFEHFFTHLNKTLGIITNSRSMTASYLDYTRASLLDLLQSLECDPKSYHQVRLLAKILENIRHLAQILHVGNHPSVHLQICLSRFIHTHIRSTKSFFSMKRILCAACNLLKSVRISYSAARDI